MSWVSLISKNVNPTEADIVHCMQCNISMCWT